MIFRPQSLMIAALILLALAPTSVLAVYHPRLGRFMQRDPVGYPDGTNTYAAHHVMHGTNDPSGLWVIDRAGGVLATAEAEPGDSILTLSAKIGLDRNDYDKWLTMTTVELVDKRIVSLKALVLKDEICPKEKVRVPNTFYALWLGDRADSITTDYRKQVADLRTEGFHVLAVGGNGSKPSRVTSKTVNDRGFLADIRALTGNRQFHGLLIEGHGRPIAVYNSSRGFYVEYQDILRSMSYKAGAGIMNVCNGCWRASDNPTRAPKHSRGWLYYQLYGYPYVPGRVPTISAGGRDIVADEPSSIIYGFRRGLNPLTENADIPALFPLDTQGTR